MKIVCFLANYIGDVLMTTPALRLLKMNLQEAKVSVIIKENLVELMEENSNIDTIILKKSKLSVLKDILEISPDYIILFRTTFFNSFVSFLSKSNSFGINEELSGLFLKKTIPKDIARPYRAECVILVEELLKSLNINKKFDPKEFKKIDFFSWNKENIKNTLHQKLIENNININKKFIIISPCASRNTKILSSEQYIEIINLLYQKYIADYEIILVNETQENIIIKEIISKCKFVKSLCGKTNLKELGCLFNMSSLVISTDSGPAYIAESVGTKTLIYFTSTLPEKYGPFFSNVRFLYIPTICSPCYKNFCQLKTYDCIKKITPATILDLVDNILK